MPLTFMSHLHLHELTDSDCVQKQDHPIPLVSVVRCRGRGQLNRKYYLYWSNVSGGHSWPAHCTGHVDTCGPVWSLYTSQRARGTYNQSLKSCNISSSQSDAASVPPTNTALYQGQFIIICLQLILSGHRQPSTGLLREERGIIINSSSNLATFPLQKCVCSKQPPGGQEGSA